MRVVRRLFLVVVCVGLGCVSPRTMRRAEKPVSDPAKRYEFPGLSVLPPQGPRWVVSPLAPAVPQNNLALVPETSLLVFSRRPEQSITSDPRSMHRALVTVTTRDLGPHPPNTVEEYLAFEQQRTAQFVGTQLSATGRLLSSKFEADATMPNCLRFEQSIENKGVAMFPGVAFIEQVRGYRCLDPQWPRYAVSVAYDDEHVDGVEPFHIDAEVEPALRSLRLTQERPVFVTPIPVGSGGQGVAVFDGSVWVAWGDHGVARINPNTNEVSQITVGLDPIGVAAGPEGVWVTNRREGTVGRIDPTTNEMTSRLAMGRLPLTIAAGDGSVWVADGGSAEVVKIDPVAGKVAARIHVGRGPSGLAVGNGAVYATSFSEGNVVRIDPATNQIVATQSLKGVSAALFPGSVATGPAVAALGEGALWVACQGDGSIYRLDPGDLHVVARVGLGTRPSGIAVGGGAVWVTLYDEFTVARIDPRTNALVGEPIPVGVRPVLAAWGADALWVTNAFSKDLSRVDP